MFRQSNDSAAFARQLLDFEPDANQAKLLSAKAQYVMVNCHRQWGKTNLTAMRAVHWAMSKPVTADCRRVRIVAAVDGVGEQMP